MPDLEYIKKPINEIVVPGKRLGRHVEHDPRSLSHPFGEVRQAAHLKTVHHRTYGKLLVQNIGSCTGMATAHALNTTPLHVAKEALLREKDAVELYSLATFLDDFPGNYPPNDTGSSGLAVAKAAKQKGLINSYKHAFSIEEALTALQYGAVITGISWYEGFDVPNEWGLVRIEGQERGGHEIAVTGFEWRRNLEDSLIVMPNSWGSDYGLKGKFTMTVGTWRTLLAQQGDVTILL